MPIISSRVYKFGLIGLLNTALDFAIYLGVFNYTQNIAVSNIIATSCALAASFLLNSRYTFNNEKRSSAQFFKFIVVTLAGVWVLQTGIIYLLSPLTQTVSLNWLGGLSNGATILLPKAIATVASLVWNYILYKEFVFKDKSN